LHALRQRYDILAEVGRGGMGIVYKARDRETGAVVALKVLKPEIAADAAVIERFKSELLMARKITHKNVCRIYELLRFGNAAVISMEYVEGETLRQFLTRYSAASIRKGGQWASQICDALSEAHAQGIVHRDLKPENIVIDSDGNVKVMDFGIARSLETTTATTGVMLGTPAYMAPEQAECKPTDTRSDIYSLGLVLYEMFTGQPAFRADTPVGFALKQIHDTPPAPRDVEPALPAHLEKAILKCLEKNPAKRFQSVVELAAALQERAIPESGDGDPAPSPHILVWGKYDWALLFIGLVGLVYFLAYRDDVFPASKMRLEIDAITARRVVQEAAARLGQPIPQDAQSQAQLDFRRDVYADGVLDWIFAGPLYRARGAPLSLSPAEPLVWHVRFEPRSASAVVDRKGKVERLSPPAWIPGNYRPATLDERRAIAKRVAEMFCGPIPTESKMKENSGGDQDATYNAEWRWKHAYFTSSPSLQVSLLAEKVTDVQCNPGAGHDLFPAIGEVRWFAGTMAAIIVLVLFVVGRCHRSPWFWKRLPMAVLLGLTGEWIVHAAMGWPDVPAPLYLFELIAASGLILTGLATAEHYLRRRAPEYIASYVLAWRGRILEPAVGLAIVRGALAGLGLVALETILAHSTLLAGPMMAGGVRWMISSWFVFLFVDPLPVAQAIQSYSWTLYTVSAAVFDGVVIGVILLGLPSAWMARRRVSSGPWYRKPAPGLLYVALIWWATGFHLHLAEFVFPPLAMVWAFLLEALFLGWLLQRYDVLTVMAAVATAVLWVINYPLLVILREVGNTGQWAVFLGWGALVLAAAAVAFQPELARRLQRAKAAIQ
jgi:predicted Ser/Thr protein kinase